MITLQSNSKNFLNQLANQFSSGDTSPTEFLINIFITIILAYILGLIYSKYGSSLSNRKKLKQTFVLMAITVMIVITIVKSSLALSLGLVGALSIVRFRTAIKEPEELVYLFFIISIGLANGANQFLLSIIATIIILIFLLTRSIYKNKNSNSGNFISDSNILNVTILQNDKKNIDDIINQLKPNFKYLKLKSANIEKATSNYIFWYESNSENFEDMLKNISKLSDENVNISIYSKSGAFE
jgi:uncharacterized membrane protein YhiD involved in acid resistance